MYDVEPMTLYNTLKTSLNQSNIGELRASYELLPIVLSDEEKKIGEIISNRNSFKQNWTDDPGERGRKRTACS